MCAVAIRLIASLREINKMLGRLCRYQPNKSAVPKEEVYWSTFGGLAAVHDMQHVRVDTISISTNVFPQLAQSQSAALPRELHRPVLTSMEPHKHVREIPPPFGVKIDIGKRKSMEDTHCVHENFMDIPMDAEALVEIVPSQVQHARGTDSSGYHRVFPDWLVKKGSLLWQRALPRSVRKGSYGAPESGRDVCIPQSRAVTLDTLHLFAIFDGHGGSKASEFCAKILHRHIRTNLGHFLTGHLHSSQLLDTKAQYCEDFARHAESVAGKFDDGQDDAEGLEVNTSVPCPACSDLQMSMGALCRGEGQTSNREAQSYGHFADQPVKSPGRKPSAPHVNVPHLSKDSSGRDGALTQGCVDGHKRVPRHPAVRATRSMNCRTGHKLLGISTGDGGAAVASHPLGRKYPSFSGLRQSGLSSHEISQALAQSFLQTDLEFAKDPKSRDVGTTALVAMVSSQLLCFCNCGDSRGVLYRGSRAMRITRDHTPACDDERRRITAQGGHIFHNDGPRVMGVLAMTRAIGDTALRPYVIADPEVTILRHLDVDEFFVLATDGLWEVMSDKDVCALVKKCFDRAKVRGTTPRAAAKLAASVVCRAALDRGAQDNITAVVVDLRVDGRKTGLN